MCAALRDHRNKSEKGALQAGCYLSGVLSRSRPPRRGSVQSPARRRAGSHKSQDIEENQAFRGLALLGPGVCGSWVIKGLLRHGRKLSFIL